MLTTMVSAWEQETRKHSPPSFMDLVFNTSGCALCTHTHMYTHTYNMCPEKQELIQAGRILLS